MKPYRQWSLQFIRFALVGVVNTLIDIGIFNILVALFGLETSWYYFSWKSIAFIGAMANSYFFNSRFTFKSQNKKGVIWRYFVLVTVVTFVISSTLSTLYFNLLSTTTDLNATLVGNISAGFSIIISMFTNFVGYKFFVFKK